MTREKVLLSVDSDVLALIDSRAQSRGMNRSAFIAACALGLVDHAGQPVASDSVDQATANRYYARLTALLTLPTGVTTWPEIVAAVEICVRANVDLRARIEEQVRVDRLRIERETHQAHSLFVGPFGRCPTCSDVGWYETGNNDLICTCAAGKRWRYSDGTTGTIVPN